MSSLTIDEWDVAAAAAGRMRVMTVGAEGGPPDSPVLLYLHGAGQASTWLDEMPGVLTHLSPPFQALQGSLGDVTVVAPQARVSSKEPWNWRPYVADIAKQLSERYAGRRIIAAGFSRGGRGVLQLMAQQTPGEPPLVAAWAVVDPQPPDADERAALMAAVKGSPEGWVRYGPQYPAIKQFGDELAALLAPGRAHFAEFPHGELGRRAFTGEPLNGPQNLYEHLGLRPDPEHEPLLKLNRVTFAAEDHASADEMAPLLDEGFHIARSTWQVQDKTQALAHVAADTSGRTRDVSDARVMRSGDRAIVTSRVTLREPSGQVAGHFWNTKMCVKQQDTWRCTAWQVIRLGD